MSAPLPPLELCGGGMPLAHSEDYPPESEMGGYMAATRWFDPEDPHRSYLRAGEELHDAIVGLLPRDWAFEGRRVLDFGCGSGRILRHFLPEADRSELWGCDIDRPGIDWLTQNLCPPLHALRNEEEPPLPFADNHFDLIWAYSVFTHLTLSWSRWLVELHRLLKPDGILIATVASGEKARFFLQRPFEEDRTGMLVRSPGTDWERGGPFVVHSEWWIRAHWGRAFEVLDYGPIATSDPPALQQTAVVLRPRQAAVTPDDLEVPEPGEPREVEARSEQLRDTRAAVAASAAAHRTKVLLLERERELLWEDYNEQTRVGTREEARWHALEARRRELLAAEHRDGRRKPLDVAGRGR